MNRRWALRRVCLGVRIAKEIGTIGNELNHPLSDNSRLERDCSFYSLMHSNDK